MSTEIENAVAIIGMSGRFPGANDIQTFWKNICNHVDAISAFSSEEIQIACVSRALVDNPNYVKTRGIVKDIELFDADFFEISPKEAQITDPQHRLFLECSWEALENAGYSSDSYSGRIGVYAGTSYSSYFLNNLFPNPQLRESVGEYLLQIGNEKDFLATRASYKLNLTGPSIVIQTACSTSLVAVSVACNHLLSYQCDIALAGAVSLSVPQEKGYLYQEGMIFSPDGQCKPFDAEAKGTVPGNGIGIVVLKCLQDALDEKDHIYAVIRGYGINNDGNRKISYSAPSVQGQMDAIRDAFAMADVNPNTIGYIEAHGTGTLLGDPIEISALTKVFQSYSPEANFCAIGSVKSNIGHLMEASGIAGLIKSTLALYHQVLPPSLHFNNPNPHIDFANSPFYVNTETKQWKKKFISRRAGVSSFGIGGTNAHLILEEAPKRQDSVKSNTPVLLILSAKTISALNEIALNLGNYLKEHPEISLIDTAYTLQVGRKTFEHKKTIICSNREEAIAILLNLDIKPSSSITHTKNYLNEIGESWTSGIDIDWSTVWSHLGIDEKPSRVPLPTYPFEKKRHWVAPFSLNVAQPSSDSSLRFPTAKGDIQPYHLQEISNFKSIEVRLLSIWREFLGVESINVSDNFFNLGGDSLLAIQIIAQIETSFGTTLKLQSLIEHPTVASLAKIISQNLYKPALVNTESHLPSILIKLKSCSCDNGGPLFFIHPIGGQVFCYKPLTESMAYEGPIYGIQASAKDGFDSIEELASYYLKAIKTLQPVGPYYLVGASFGGLVAYEMARQLRNTDQEIGLLSMFDICRPNDPLQQSHNEIEALLQLIELFKGKTISVNDFKKLSTKDQMALLMENMNLSPLSLSKQQEIFEQIKRHLHATTHYHPKPYDGKIIFFQAKDRFFRMNDISLGKSWEKLAKDGVEVHEVLGNHLTMLMQPNAQSLAHLLDSYTCKLNS